MVSAPAGAGIFRLMQLPGTAGCVSDTGTGGACTDGLLVQNVRGVAVSPDGRNVYATAEAADAVLVFDRDPATGELTQKAGTAGCVTETGSGGGCTDGKALNAPQTAAVSRDGRNVYVASQASNAVAVFDRDAATGELTQKGGTAGCISETGTGGACVDGEALDDANRVVVSPDGRSVYVVSQLASQMAIFDRDPATGELTQKVGMAGCVSDTGSGGACIDAEAFDFPKGAAVSPDGRNLYVASATSDAVAVFDRDLSTLELTQKAGTAGCVSDLGAGGCTAGSGLDGAQDVVVSDDGRHVYVAAQIADRVSLLDRDLATGELTPHAGVGGCVSETGSGGNCGDGRGLDGVWSLAMSSDAESLVGGSLAGDSVALLQRDSATGELTQELGIDACISEDGSGGECLDGVALDGVQQVAMSADGKSVYVASLTSDAVAAIARAIQAYDIDGDGEVVALTDGLLLLRYAFGFRDAALIAGAVDLASCTRCTADEIETFIEELGG